MILLQEDIAPKRYNPCSSTRWGCFVSRRKNFRGRVEVEGICGCGSWNTEGYTLSNFRQNCYVLKFNLNEYYKSRLARDRSNTLSASQWIKIRAPFCGVVTPLLIGPFGYLLTRGSHDTRCGSGAIKWLGWSFYWQTVSVPRQV